MATSPTSETKKEATGPVISGGHLVAKALKNEGVDVIWTLCGGHIIDIYDGCLDEGIKIIDVRHEQVAAHAADGYARQSGKIGCVVTTAGPGTTNAVTGIANAFRAESPLLHDRRPGRAQSQHKMGSLQDLPHVDMMSPITKFAASVPQPSASPTWSPWRFAKRSTARRGRAIWKSRATCSTRRSDRNARASPSRAPIAPRRNPSVIPRDIEKLADLLVNAERPAACSARRCGLAAVTRRRSQLLRAPQHSRLHERRRPRHLPPGDPHHFNRTRSYGLRQGRRDRHRRHAVRFPHGLRRRICAPMPLSSRSTSTIAPSARTATSPSVSSATAARFSKRSRKPLPGGRPEGQRASAPSG